MRYMTTILIMMLAATMLTACGESPDQRRGVVVLVDISDEYAREMDKAIRLSNYLLANLDGGDSMAVAFIDNSSYSERNVIASRTFDHRPSVANGQKRAFQEELHDFMARFSVPSYHSDITGGILLARDYLEEVNAGEKHLFVLSDMREDLPPDLNRDMELDMDGIDVHAVNVIRHRPDNRDPGAWRQRIADWRERVERGGGSWQMVNEMGRLEESVALR